MPTCMLQGNKNEREQVMGMAASQARFLGLTARKTNTEYEGQQINQQRTVLSNESANYYNQLLGMSVPVPPAVADYTKTVYTFNDGALTNSISSMIAQPGGKYIVSYTTSWVNDFSAISAAPILYTRVEKSGEEEEKTYDYKVGAKTLRLMSTDTTLEDLIKFRDEYNDEYLKSLSKEQLENLLAEEKEQIKILNKKFGVKVSASAETEESKETEETEESKESEETTTSTGTSEEYNSQWMVRYVKNTSTGTWSPYFVDKTLLESENMVYTDEGQAQSATRTYTIGSAQETEEFKGVSARMEQDSTGRVIKITLHPEEDDEVTYAVSTTTITDQAKYDDAMNQYEYDKAQYDQSIQEVNAKIEVIQAEDKNLELRLKQLDTEQDAIQTEMEAVQKVIEKNTESTFKTFG